MRFADVVGQEKAKALLRRQVAEGRVAHALLFAGPEGSGKMAMALALAQLLVCRHAKDGEPCGECADCRHMARMAHPDVHFSFPVIKKSESTTADTYIDEWRALMKDGPYFGLSEWLQCLSTDNKQMQILEAEADNVIAKMSKTSFLGGRKVMIMWLPERMTAPAANNLLKLLEEPAPGTVFILLSDDTTNILTTILSRTQRVPFARLTMEEIVEALVTNNGIDRQLAVQVARTAGGSYLNALRSLRVSTDQDKYFELFTGLMRMAYARDLMGLKRWGETLGELSRDGMKAFFTYAQNMIRENYINNFHHPDLGYMTDREADFAQRFSPFINDRNVRQFVTALQELQRDIEGNVSPKTACFDFALQCAVLIRK